MKRTALSQFGVVVLVALVIVSAVAAPLTAAPVASAEETQRNDLTMRNGIEDTSSGVVQTADISPPETQTFAPGGVYPVVVTVDVGSGSFLSSDRIEDPRLDLTVEGDATIESVQPTDYGETVQQDETTASLSAADFFRTATSQTAVVLIEVSESADNGSVSVSATPGDGGESASSTTATYDITSQESTWDAMKGSADARATLASSYRTSYDRLLYNKPWNETVQTSMRDGFSTVITEETKGAVLGSIPGVGTALEARDAYQVATGEYEGGTAGQVAAINQKLKNDLDARMTRDDVRRAGNSSAPLTELERLYEQEQDAWEQQDREKLREILLRQRAVLVDACIPQASSNPYADDYDTCLAIESDEQRTASLSSTEFGDSNGVMAQYFAALETFSYEEYERVDSRLNLVRKPNPSVRPTEDPATIEERLNDLETNETTNVTFTVSNAPGAGISGELGFLSLSHGESLAIREVTERTDGDANVSVDRIAPGEEALNASGEPTELDHHLVDVFTQYEPGDEREFRVTVERTADGEAWLAYRAALEPFLMKADFSEAEAQAAFAREPTSGPIDQQDWHVRNLSTAATAEPPLPVIDVPSDPTTDTPIEFHAGESTADATIESYGWEVDKDGDGTVETTATGDPLSVEFDTAGTAQVKLTVTDAEGRTATTTTAVDVSDVSVSEMTTDLSFAADRDFPEPGETLTYDAPTDVSDPSWSVTREGTEIDSGSGEIFETTVNESGTYEVTLSGMVDGRDVSETRAVVIASREERVAAPSISVSAPLSADTDETISIDASESTHPHPDRDISEFELFVDGASVASSPDGVFEYAFDDTGEYELDIRAKGSAGNVTTVTRDVTVGDTALEPSIEISPAEPEADESITFDASNSTAGTSIESYVWTFPDEWTSSGETIERTFQFGGEYDVELEVTDADGRTATVERTVNVSGPEQPTFVVDISPAEPKAGEIVTFDASNSTAETSIESYEWTFSDGQILTGETISREFESGGEYDVGLRVTDADGRTAATERTFGVLDSDTPTSPGSPTCSDVDYNGSGTTDDPYEVEDVDQLQCIQNLSLSGHYVLVSDVDASGTAEWNNGEGFDPIGQSKDVPFTGSFDGKGHTISGLVIDRTEEGQNYIGMFSYLDGGTIENVTLQEADIEGRYRVGGIVGFNDDGIVSGSSVAGNVTGDSEAGGLIGINAGRIVESYATANVSSPWYVGGLVGDNRGTVDESYAAGTVFGDSEVGGLVGFGNDGTVTASYWDINSTGRSSSAGGIGLTTAQMTGDDAPGNMTAFDFNLTWQTRPSDYPDNSRRDDFDEDRSEPDASISLSSTTVTLGETVSLNGSNSTGDIQQYEWDLTGDGTTDATGEATSHIFNSTRTRQITLTITDSNGVEATTTRNVSVTRLVEERTYDVSYNEEFKDIEQTADGGFTLTGRVDPPSDTNTLANYWLVRIDSSGNELLNRSYGDPDTSQVATGVTETTEGYAMVGTDGRVIKVDEQGDRQWTTETDAFVTADILSTDDGLLILGNGVTKLNNSGDIEWTALEEVGYAGDAIETADGDYVVTGRDNHFEDDEVFIARLDPTGDVEWQQRYGGTGHHHANGIARTADGGFAVAGTSHPSDDQSIQQWVFETDADGDVEWSRRFGGTENDYAEDIVQATDGGYVVAGDSQSYGTGERSGVVTKLNDSGGTEWREVIGDRDEYPTINGLATTSRGTYLAVGSNDEGAWTVELVGDDPDANRPPQIRYENWSAELDVGASGTLDVSPSYDPEGTATTVEWSLGDGTSDTRERLNHAYESPGEYNVSVTVTDDDGLNTTATRTVIITDPLDTNLTVDASSVTLGDLVEFDATDTTGNITEYAWDVDNDGINESTTTAETFTYTYEEPGTYQATVTAVGENGSDTDSVEVTVESGETDALSAALDALSTVEIGETVTLDASDTDGDILEYNWDVDGDGIGEAESETPTYGHAYEEPGTYDVTVTAYAEDSSGDVVSDEATVSIEVVADTAADSANVTIADTDLSDEERIAGENVRINVTLNNTADEEKTISVSFFEDDSLFLAQQYDVPANANRTVTVARTFPDSGSYNLSVQNDETDATIEVGTVTVEENDETSSEMPGFGVIPAIAALLGVMGILRRLRR